MNIYDTANKLATEIKDSSEYTEYKKLKELINNNEDKKMKVEEFEHLRYKIQLNQIQGNLDSIEEDKNTVQEKYSKLLQDEEIKKYFEVEVKFNVMIADVNRIIAEAIKDVI